MDGKLFIKAKNPDLPIDRNTMNNWHKLIDRQLIGKFKFAIANIPVVVVIYGSLNAAAETTEKVTAEFTVGAQARGSAKIGARWDVNNGWKEVSDMNWDQKFWMPTRGNSSRVTPRSRQKYPRNHRQPLRLYPRCI